MIKLLILLLVAAVIAIILLSLWIKVKHWFMYCTLLGVLNHCNCDKDYFGTDDFSEELNVIMKQDVEENDNSIFKAIAKVDERLKRSFRR